jgi:hypothetical protein
MVAAAYPVAVAAEDVPTGPIQIESVKHANSMLVLFDQYDRQYVLRDGQWVNEEGTKLELVDGKIHRVVGCGKSPCDFTTHATRVVDRSILVYAELAIPDGKYHHEGGSWFRIQAGELIEYMDSP